MAIPEEVRQWRKAQRTELLARRLAAPEAERRTWNARLTALLVERFPILQWMVVGFYWPCQGEFDPRFAIRSLRRMGTRAALPVVVEKNAPLEYREWWPGARMGRGVFNLPIPEGTAVVRPEALLIPPVGFDRQGYRLGYGGGYFDRTLADSVPQPLKIGVAFELSRIPTIQPQPHDVPMDFIVTETGIYYVREDGLELLNDPLQVLRLAGSIIRDRDAIALEGFHAPAADVREPSATPRHAAHD